MRALSILFRAKFRDAMRAAGLYDQIDPAVWEQDWVVHCQPAGDGRTSLQYLAPYVFRVAINDRRVVAFDDETVTFSYRKSGSQRGRKMTLEVHEFIRRFLQHVLPAGFQKVRHYGFESAASRHATDALRGLVTLASGHLFLLLSQSLWVMASPPRHRCPDCGGMLCLVGLILPGDAPAYVYFDTS